MRSASPVRPASRAPNSRVTIVPLCSCAGENQVLAHGQLGEDLQQLERAADAEPVEVARPHAGDGAAVELHLAGTRPELAEDAVEQRRLAAAVRPDDAEDLALVDVERHAVDGLDAAEALARGRAPSGQCSSQAGRLARERAARQGRAGRSARRPAAPSRPARSRAGSSFRRSAAIRAAAPRSPRPRNGPKK